MVTFLELSKLVSRWRGGAEKREMRRCGRAIYARDIGGFRSGLFGGFEAEI